MVFRWPIEIDGLPINSMLIFHGELLSNQMVGIPGLDPSRERSLLFRATPRIEREPVYTYIIFLIYCIYILYIVIVAAWWTTIDRDSPFFMDCDDPPSILPSFFNPKISQTNQATEYPKNDSGGIKSCCSDCCCGDLQKSGWFVMTSWPGPEICTEISFSKRPEISL